MLTRRRPIHKILPATNRKCYGRTETVQFPLRRRPTTIGRGLTKCPRLRTQRNVGPATRLCALRPLTGSTRGLTKMGHPEKENPQPPEQQEIAGGVGPGGFEPPTHRLRVCCSTRLSYEPVETAWWQSINLIFHTCGANEGSLVGRAHRPIPPGFHRRLRAAAYALDGAGISKENCRVSWATPAL